MRVSDYIASFLHTQGVTHVFELVGGMITHLVDSVHQQGQIQLVSMHHEQAAAFAADGMARVTGVPGVAMATSGPGATNLLTGIGGCYFDSSPAVFITGQVNRNEQKGHQPIRQLGFQETDIVAMVGPITKAAWRVKRAEDVPTLLAEAFVLATSGRPGPVLLDIPMDVQRENLDIEAPQQVASAEMTVVQPEVVEELLVALERAERPLVLVGGGIRAAKASELLRQFVDQVGVPVVNSLLAVDALPASHSLRVGMIGSYGNRWANMAIGQSDFMLVLGSRLDIRQTGADTDGFKGQRIIYHVDCEAGDMNNRVTGCRTVLADLRPFLKEAIHQSANRPIDDRGRWRAEISALKERWPDTAELLGIPGINPNEFMHQLAAASTEGGAYVVDVGQHQMWAAQSLELQPHQRFLTSAGMGSMGFGLPAAIGVALASPDQPTIMIAGDGGFQLNIQELQTVVRNRLPIKIVVINNHCHGMVRQFQQSYFGERYQSTYWGYSAPDFARVAQAYGIASCAVDQPAEVDAALRWLWQNAMAPALLEVGVDTFANAYPKLAFGLPITEMEPLATPLGMEGT